MDGVDGWARMEVEKREVVNYKSVETPRRSRGSMVEHLSSEQKVVGSSPIVITIFPRIAAGRLRRINGDHVAQW